jgi:hypothetical protein
MLTEVTDHQIAIWGLTQGTNLRAASAPRATDNQTSIGGLTQGTNLGVGVPGVTDNQTAIGGLTQGTNHLGIGCEGQANHNRSHYR